MHVCIWRCEHAMFSMEILMYKFSLTQSCIYIYKSVYVRVVHDLELLCSSLCDRTTSLISHRD